MKILSLNAARKQDNATIFAGLKKYVVEVVVVSAAGEPARARRPKPTSHMSRFSKKNDLEPYVKASKSLSHKFLDV